MRDYWSLGLCGRILHMPQPILVLVRDLMFASKISATAQAAGVPVKLIRDPEKLADESGDRLIVDLNQAGALEAATKWKADSGTHVIGFVSHVDRETIDRARSLGIDEVLPRSQFVQRLADLLR